MTAEDFQDLFYKGSDAWNDWRKKFPHINPSFAGLYLDEMDFSPEFNLTGVNFHTCHLKAVSFFGTNLERAIFSEAFLSRVRFQHCNMKWVDFRKSQISNSIFWSSNLEWVDFTGSFMPGSDFTSAILGKTIFGSIDLTQCKGLANVTCLAPCVVGIDTVLLSRGSIPIGFLEKNQVGKSAMDFVKKVKQIPNTFYTCFVSYSSKDRLFVNKLIAELSDEGINCWVDKSNLKIGEPFPQMIKEAIASFDKFIVIVSRNSIESKWVLQEMEYAKSINNLKQQPFIFPLLLHAKKENIPVLFKDLLEGSHMVDFYRHSQRNIYTSSKYELINSLRHEPKKRIRNSK